MNGRYCCRDIAELQKCRTCVQDRSGQEELRRVWLNNHNGGSHGLYDEGTPFVLPVVMGLCFVMPVVGNAGAELSQGHKQVTGVVTAETEETPRSRNTDRQHDPE